MMDPQNIGDLKLMVMDYAETTRYDEWKVSREMADEMMETIARLKEDFLLDKVTLGDGQCFFTATIQQLRRPDVQEKLSKFNKQLSKINDPKAVKLMIRRFMIKNKHPVVERIKKDFKNFMEGMCWDEYWSLDNMKRKEFWADEMFVRSTAWFLKLDIVLHQNVPGASMKTISGNIENEEVPCSGSKLHFAYLLNRHYQSVLPRTQDVLQDEDLSFDCEVEEDASLTIKTPNKPKAAKSVLDDLMNENISNDRCPVCGKTGITVLKHIVRAKQCKENVTKEQMEQLKYIAEKSKLQKEKEYRKRKQNDDCEKLKESAKRRKQNERERSDSQKIKDDNNRWKKAERERTDPEKIKENNKQWKKAEEERTNPEKIKENNKQRKKAERERTDPEKIKENNKQWKKAERERADPEKIKENNNQWKQAERERADPGKIKEDNNRWQHRHRKIDNEDQRLKSFLENTLFGPIFVCLSCQQKHFKSNIQEFSNDVKANIESKISLKDCIADMKILQKINFGLASSTKIKMNQFICKTCLGYLRKGKLPSTSVMNNLKLNETDKDLEEEGLVLTELENSLIASRIIFQKIFLLPKSRWSAMKDKQINIPITSERINETLEKLPRMPRDAGLIGVELKRKIEYKNCHKHQLINPHKLFEFIDKAKWKGNPYYQDVLTFDSYKKSCNKSDKIGFNLVFGETNKEVETGDNEQHHEVEDKLVDEILLEEYETMDPVKKYQFKYNDSVTMTDKYPEISVAPGENQTPKNLLFDDNWDVMAFPSLHNLDGSNGKDQERDVKLTAQRYFIQRITNINSRFSKCSAYLYAAVGYLEQMRINRNINLVGTRGKKINSDSGKSKYELHDPYHALDAIPGTPKYWQKAKYEMYAKIDNFGPFQIFYTLSCGDRRWPSNLAAIFLEKGVDIQYEVLKDGNNWEQIIKAKTRDGSWKQIKQFLEDEVDESHHELIRGNVVTATRYFDHRVKCFLRDIVMQSSNPMCVKYYTYKVEFQARGAGHVHGTLWLDLDKLETLIRRDGKLAEPRENENLERRPLKGIKNAFKTLRNNKDLSNQDIEVLKCFAEEFTTVTTQKETVGEDVSLIARDVNQHHHTHTCRKYNNECRFGFEKLPSPETFIAQPVKGESKVKLKILKKIDDTIKKVKEVLSDENKMKKISKNISKGEDMPVNEYKQRRLQRIQMLLKEAGVTMEDYKTALQTTKAGYSVVLARDIDETKINNFNEEWLRAWNANIDIQICLDFHAVVTYITDYYSKCETELVRIIKAALENSDATNNKDKMKTVADVFQRSRQMGEAEAVYKLIPNMVLTNSNVTCQWVAIGTAEERSTRYLKAQQSHIEAGIPLVELDGHDGLWYQQQDMWTKYLRRSDELKSICFAQFAKMYRGSSTKTLEENIEECDDSNGADDSVLEDGQVNKFDFIMTFYDNGSEGKKLPECFSLKSPVPGESSVMQKRSSPVALRFHKIKQNNDSERYLFGEVMLYYPLVDEISIEKARQLYKETFNGIRKIDLVKKQVMEFLEGVEEARYHLEMLEADSDLSDIARALDAQGEKDNEECEEMEQEISEFDHINPDDLLLRSDKSTSSGMYKKIIIPHDEDLKKSTRNLDVYQREVLNIIIKYARDLVKSRKRQYKVPKPPYLMMHGGAGAGKSTVIRIVAQWFQKTVQQEGQGSDCPCVVITAFCGTAAANVDGQTMHSSFGFSFGNEHYSLNDKSRDTRRAILKYLKLVIIDEVSMIKSDMLYQLDLRLQEIKEKVGIPFGGVGVLVFGDLMQLPPCLGRYVFDEPLNKDYLFTHRLSPRWRMFQPILLEENHRQGRDKSYAELLNRLRVKEYTEEDIRVLRERVRPAMHPDVKGAGIYITGKRKPCDMINDKYISKLQGEALKLKAIHHHAIQGKNYRPKIDDKDKSVGGTSFRDEIILKPKARIIMIHNLDTVDSLTNGQLGTFIDAIRNKEGKVEKLILKMDKSDAGKYNREKYPDLAKKYPNHVFVERVSMQYSLTKMSKKTSSATATVIQFPIRLAYGITAHKFQGSTVPHPTTVAMDIDSTFTAGQSYVMLSRVQSLDQVIIVQKLEERKLMMSEKALEESQRLERESLNRNPSIWMMDTQRTLKVASLNCAGLRAHFQDILVDQKLLKADIILLQETSLQAESADIFGIPSYTFHFHVKIGNGRGVSIYLKEKAKERVSIPKNGYQIAVARFDGSDVINIYRSSNGSKSELCDDLRMLIQAQKQTIILGDLNICGQQEKNNQVTLLLQSLGFEQMMKEATHLGGRQIDHCFYRGPSMISDLYLERYSPYYSDHDAILLTL